MSGGAIDPNGGSMFGDAVFDGGFEERVWRSWRTPDDGEQFQRRVDLAVVCEYIEWGRLTDATLPAIVRAIARNREAYGLAADACDQRRILADYAYLRRLLRRAKKEIGR